VVRHFVQPLEEVVVTRRDRQFAAMVEAARRQVDRTDDGPFVVGEGHLRVQLEVLEPVNLDARFAKKVVDAYGGTCAMCGLDAGLIEGAHIYPAAAPLSPDEPWNGLVLCPTHHTTFDRHLVAVRPTDHAIVYNSVLTHQVDSNPAAAALVGCTFPSLALPAETSMCPRQEMFVQRYKHFGGQYDWLIA
jgi:HNH endonuclease